MHDKTGSTVDFLHPRGQWKKIGFVPYGERPMPGKYRTFRYTVAGSYAIMLQPDCEGTHPVLVEIEGLEKDVSAHTLIYINSDGEVLEFPGLWWSEQ